MVTILKKFFCNPIPYVTLNSHLYHYAGNNPITYTDPNGRFIWKLLSCQYQNNTVNANVYIGQYTTNNTKDCDEKENTLANFGCLFTCFVNIGNSYNAMKSPDKYFEKTAASLASNDKYFEFQSVSRIGGTPTDFKSSIENLKALLFDMTGEQFEILKFECPVAIKMAVLASITKQGTFIVGKTITKQGSEHFININSIEINKNTKDFKMDYFDPYQYNNPKNRKSYSLFDLKAVYLIYRKTSEVSD